MKKAIISLLLVIMVAVLSGPAQAQTSPERKNSLALKAGYHLYTDSDFIDFWSKEKKDYNGFAAEISYERKINRFIGVEAAGGFYSSTKFYTSALLASDSLDTKFTNYYFAPSVKAYLPVKNFSFYIGAGPDFYHTVVKINYSQGGLSYNDSKGFNTFGYHALAGIEYLFYANPGADGFYDAPVSLLVEYKYTGVTVKEADEDAINYLNTNLATSMPKHDLDVGGHSFMVGLRWHF